MAKHPIPRAVDPAAIYWLQPKREDIVVDDVFATMGHSAFLLLSLYTGSPSVVYVGKMWKRSWNVPGQAARAYYLCWYDRQHGQFIVCQRRIILK